MKTFRYRLYPSNYQQKILWSHSKTLNNLYNFFLNLKINTYKDYKLNLSKSDLDKILTDLKRDFEYPVEIYSQVLQQPSRRLDKTFRNFFNSNFGYPKFRSCKKFFNILYPQSGYKIENNKFITSSYGTIKFKKHLKLEGNIKQVEITHNCNTNTWYLNIVTDSDSKLNINTSKSTYSMIGLDLGITNYVTLSNGEVFRTSIPKYYDKIINKLKSKRDKSCKRNSRRYKYLSLRIRKLYDVKRQKLNDFLHKVSKYLAVKYDIVMVEDLEVKFMSESKIKGLNREIRNMNWSDFISKLEYKCGYLLKVDPAYTSKTCFKCGKIHDLKLSDRTMNCDCGRIVDRDLNAAQNVYKRGYDYLYPKFTSKSKIVWNAPNLNLMYLDLKLNCQF